MEQCNEIKFFPRFSSRWIRRTQDSLKKQGHAQHED